MFLAVQILELRSTAMASDRVEIDTIRAFRSVKEAVTLFGERILVAQSHSRYGGTGNAVPIVNPQTDDKHDEGGSSSTLLSPNAMEEADGAGRAAIVPTYYAPSSLPSFTSSQSQDVDDGDNQDIHDGEAGFASMSSIIKKLEAEVSETRREVVLLRKRGTQMEMAVASLNAQLRQGLSRLAELEPDKAEMTVHGERWDEKPATYSSEYLPSFSHALSLGEIDNDDELLAYGRRRKAQKVKPIVPLVGDIFSKSFSKRKNSSTNDGGNLYSVMGC